MKRSVMKKILVVDDEEALRDLYRMELEDAGYQVKVAASGEEALKDIAIFSPDLVVLDIRMPGMSGLEVLGKIRQTWKILPVILCSAYGEYKQDFACWASDAYVVKSSRTGELLDTIRRLLGEKI
jgi:CheY-like chemotaxis protein